MGKFTMTAATPSEEARMKTGKLRLTAKAEKDGVGKAGDGVEHDDPRIAYLQLHGYVDPSSGAAPSGAVETGAMASPSKVKGPIQSND